MKGAAEKGTIGGFVGDVEWWVGELGGEYLLPGWWG